MNKKSNLDQIQLNCYGFELKKNEKTRIIIEKVA